LTEFAQGARREMARAMVDAAGTDCRLLVMIEQPSPEQIEGWRDDSDAIIYAQSARSDQLAAAVASGLPVVLLSSQRLDLGLPSVLADERRIGWLAGRHLIDRGCGHFAYVGMADHDGSALRQAGFDASLADHGVGCEVQTLLAESQRSVESDAQLRQLISDLPESSGILAFSDNFALRVIEIAHELGRPVPRDIAVVGIGNDDLLCLISHPTLSSVDADSSRIGRDALKLALQLARGEAVDVPVRRIDPLGVVARGSTNPTAMVRNPLVRAALDRLDRTPAEQMSIDRLLNELVVSRSTLDRAFRQVFGRTAYEEIRRRRLTLVRNLLAETGLSGVQIAGRAGFRHLSNLSAAFKAEFGMTLTEFREGRAQ
jgi:LacI family transcriptional regulator